MAFTFNGTSDKLLDTSNVALTDSPATLAGWVNFPTNTGQRTLVGMSDSASSNSLFRLGIDNNIVMGQFRNDATQLTTLSTTGTITNDVWVHIACTFVSGTPGLETFINGVSADTAFSADVTGPITLTSTEIGVLQRSSASQFWNGGAAEIGAWNVVLTDEELLELAAGYPPSMVRPTALAMYNPLKAFSQDVIGATDYTVTGTSLIAHPPMLQVSGQVIPFPAGAAASPISIEVPSGGTPY